MSNSRGAEKETGGEAAPGKARLLTDGQVQRFIADGYLTVHADYPPSFHEGIRRQLDSVLEKEGNPGNNILPRIPEIGQVFRHPAGGRGPDQPPRSRVHPQSAPALPPQPARKPRADLAQGLLRLRPQPAPPAFLLGARLLLPAGHHPGDGPLGASPGDAVPPHDQRPGSRGHQGDGGGGLRPGRKRWPSFISTPGTAPSATPAAAAATCSSSSSRACANRRPRPGTTANQPGPSKAATPIRGFHATSGTGCGAPVRMETAARNRSRARRGIPRPPASKRRTGSPRPAGTRFPN